MRSGRLACMVVPLFPLAARLRSEPELAQEAVAVFEGNGNAARLVAATRSARRVGLKPGLTLPQACARLPKLTIRPRDPECERSAQEALLEAAETVSPRTEDAGGGTVYVDTSGLERRYPQEILIGTALMDAAEAEGLPVKVGIASSKLAARVAADSPGSPTRVPEGDEAQFLAPLPLSRLAPQVQVAGTLERWGIRSIGELAHLPAAEVASRLGRIGSDLHAIARGIDPRPLVPRSPPALFREGMGLEWPLVSLEPFLFVGRAALDRLCRRLESRGLACKRLEVGLRLEPDGRYERAIELPAPTRDAKTLLTLLRLELEARPPGAPVLAFALTAYPDRPQEAQLTLFGPAALSPDRLAATLARLFALLGPERVGSPRALDAHRPEGFRLEPYVPPPPPEAEVKPPQARGLLGARALRPAVPLEVITAGPAPGGQESRSPSGNEVAEPAAPYGDSPPALPEKALEGAPVAGPLRLLSISTPTEAQEAKRPRIQGRVRVASGPWSLEEEWWSEQPVERDYWDVELTDGGLYRVYRDRASGEWFADGIYD